MVAPLVIPLAAGVAAGVGAAGKGVADMIAARSMAKDAKRLHEANLNALEAAQVPLHARTVEYGEQQLAAVTDTIGRFAEWIERNQMSVNRLAHETVDGVKVDVPDLPQMKSEVKMARNWIRGGVAGGTAAAAAPFAALMGVSALGTASTGAAISGLTGAALKSATLAWLGGGSLAAGGGGMAAGAIVLNLIAVAPAALIGGFTVGVIGSKQKTSAKRYVAEVSAAVENIQTAIHLFPKISERIFELSAILRALATRAEVSIDTLESLSFDPDEHASYFVEALQLIRGIREIVNTPVIDAESGELTSVSLQVIRKYQ